MFPNVPTKMLSDCFRRKNVRVHLRKSFSWQLSSNLARSSSCVLGQKHNTAAGQKGDANVNFCFGNGNHCHVRHCLINCVYASHPGIILMSQNSQLMKNIWSVKMELTNQNMCHTRVLTQQIYNILVFSKTNTWGKAIYISAYLHFCHLHFCIVCIMRGDCPASVTPDTCSFGHLFPPSYIYGSASSILSLVLIGRVAVSDAVSR